MMRRSPLSTLFPYTTLFRSRDRELPPPGLRHALDRAHARRQAPGTGRRGGGRPHLDRRRRRERRAPPPRPPPLRRSRRPGQDRKSTRLNSSHANISYAVFCLNDAPLSAIYTLSLHDALPISRSRATAARATARPGSSACSPTSSGHRAPRRRTSAPRSTPSPRASSAAAPTPAASPLPTAGSRSEEHTSELQSRQYLVCRLLLE